MPIAVEQKEMGPLVEKLWAVYRWFVTLIYLELHRDKMARTENPDILINGQLFAEHISSLSE